MVNATIAVHDPGAERIRLVEVDLAAPGPFEVMVALEASGVCRSQLTEMARHTAGAPLPLGHEGIGVVEAVGPSVTTVSPGDRVIVTWVPAAGPGMRDALPTSLELPDGTRTAPVRCFTWATRTVVDELYAVPLAADDTDPSLALLGCAVMTGAESVATAARTRLGESVVVIGAGGVGLAAISAAAAAGAGEVVAVDVDREKLEFAAGFGANRLVDARSGDPVEQVHAALAGSPSGADVVIDCVGAPATIVQALAMAKAGVLGERPGGRVVVAGLAGGEVAVDARELVMTQKSLIGTLAGGAAQADILRHLAATRAGRLQVARSVTDTATLGELADSVDRLRVGDILGRAIVTMSA
ncbi:zinc-binding dehydrogenase [Herbiconiux sp. A18JL235]|uniref:Zinc-binding dehydrogenase n=1 Tax=Herbiconiux sp. A18JL235 TaxID=3152363 RepID=A0AB39BFL7_9MICO